jgi:OOP family OmpA-OmpF porin
MYFYIKQLTILILIHNKMKLLIRLTIAIVIVGLTNCVNGQINIPGKIRDKVNDRANQHVDEAIDKGLDATEEGVEDAVTGDEKENDENSEEKKKTEDKQETSKSSQGNKAATEQPGTALQSFTKYDFIPGDKVLFFEDFSQDAVGDFPALWTTNGSGEIRTLNNYPGNWLYMNSADNVYKQMHE